MKKDIKRNLTRFTYEDTAFQGWRLCISREGKTFVKYFSDKKFGSSEAALSAAEEMLAKILAVFHESQQKHGRITQESLMLAKEIIK